MKTNKRCSYKQTYSKLYGLIFDIYSFSYGYLKHYCIYFYVTRETKKNGNNCNLTTHKIVKLSFHQSSLLNSLYNTSNVLFWQVFVCHVCTSVWITLMPPIFNVFPSIDICWLFLHKQMSLIVVHTIFYLCVKRLK